MDNANKAIIMAFGMIVAVMILGAIVWVFTRLSSLPVQDDSLEDVEQRRLFNQEYEVYDKRIMYGVDVISVLNKAQSNNEKYVKTKFFSGVGYNTDYVINIAVKIKSTLDETMKISYVEITDTGIIEKDYTEGNGPAEPLLAMNAFRKAPSAGYQSLIYTGGVSWTNMSFKTQTINTSLTAGVYQLLSGGSEPMASFNTAYRLGKSVDNYTDSMLEGNTRLKQLMTQSSTMSQVVRNTQENTGTNGWSQAIWYPAVYDLKTRKFKCNGDETIYSPKTGRIVYMEFEEI